MTKSQIFQPDLFRGKVAVITGGGSGINLGIAERFSGLGATVVLIGRTQEKLNAAARGITAKGGKAFGFSADVRDYAALDSALGKAREAAGEFDIVVCGAAGNFPAAAMGMSANGFKAVIDIDVLGTYNTCRAAFAHLRKSGASIINISAPQAFMPIAMQAHVCAAKAGVDMLTRTLALEWGREGIRVNSIVPGPIDDTEGMRRLAPSETSRKKMLESVPAGRLGEKRDIAELAVFLCSSAATFITGAVMVCDGGQSLSGPGAWLEAMTAGE